MAVQLHALWVLVDAWLSWQKCHEIAVRGWTDASIISSLTIAAAIRFQEVLPLDSRLNPADCSRSGSPYRASGSPALNRWPDDWTPTPVVACLSEATPMQRGQFG